MERKSRSGATNLRITFDGHSCTILYPIFAGEVSIRWIQSTVQSSGVWSWWFGASIFPRFPSILRGFHGFNGLNQKSAAGCGCIPGQILVLRCPWFLASIDINCPKKWGHNLSPTASQLEELHHHRKTPKGVVFSGHLGAIPWKILVVFDAVKNRDSPVPCTMLSWTSWDSILDCYGW